MLHNSLRFITVILGLKMKSIISYNMALTIRAVLLTNLKLLGHHSDLIGKASAQQIPDLNLASQVESIARDQN